jgi:uncharacterized membrane protein SpoIIM required for sporulation
MVLESLIGEKNIRKQPLYMLLITFVISIGSIIAAYNIAPAHSSVLSVAFITIGLIPIIHNILTKEEYEEAIERKSAVTFFARHFNLILIYVFIFIGVILAFSVVYITFPQDVNQVVFQEQINSFCWLQKDACAQNLPLSITGQATASSLGYCREPSMQDPFMCSFVIFENNAKVLLFIIILSILYGAGAIYIIAWNASILGLFFGEMILTLEHGKAFSFALTMIIGHGASELMAYIFGALAGAVLSAMVSRGQFLSHEFSTILKDVLFLALLGLFSVAYGSLAEGLALVGLADFAVIMGFIYLLVLIIVVYLYGTKRKK